MNETIKPPPSLAQLRARRDEILATAKQNGAFDVRIFGSVARGETNATSDIDFLVTFDATKTIFDQVRLWLDLQELLGCEVDLLTDHPEAGHVTDQARKEAIPL